jgi:hypothetical protein
MKLREIIRPQQLDEFDIKGSLGQANTAAKAYWSKVWPKIAPLVKGAGAAAIVYTIYEGMEDQAKIDCSALPKDECFAAKRAIWARIIAQYGVDAVAFWIGSIAGGFTGPAAWVGVPAGGILTMIGTHLWIGKDVDKATDWIVATVSGLAPGRYIAHPTLDKPEHGDVKRDPRQQAYRQGQVGMDTPNNPDPRKHPERYPKD